MTGLDQLITGPTTLDSKIDLVYTNSDCVQTAGILDFSLSDHNPVFVTRKKIKTKTHSQMFYDRSYAKYDKDMFEET